MSLRLSYGTMPNRSGAERKKRRGMSDADVAFLSWDNKREAEARVAAKRAKANAENEDTQKKLEARFALERAQKARARAALVAQFWASKEQIAPAVPLPAA